jgi:hypothetical protein
MIRSFLMSPHAGCHSFSFSDGDIDTFNSVVDLTGLEDLEVGVIGVVGAVVENIVCYGVSMRCKLVPRGDVGTQ